MKIYQSQSADYHPEARNATIPRYRGLIMAQRRRSVHQRKSSSSLWSSSCTSINSWIRLLSLGTYSYCSSRDMFCRTSQRTPRNAYSGGATNHVSATGITLPVTKSTVPAINAHSCRISSAHRTRNRVASAMARISGRTSRVSFPGSTTGARQTRQRGRDSPTHWS